ncbi:hypothetical protein [Streptomyces humi]|uniref:hypothetical protein n=1 Tax=Streptomyces humi TaxID=1428620 RepID=UPI00062879ED|nr:hypothetical protein [Streptomyces humi]
MSERRDGEGVRDRRRARNGDAWSGPADVRDDAGVLETVLAAVIRADELAAGTEQRAVAAFRAARAAGAHQARTRRRDDWRPAGQRRARRPLKLTFGVAFAGLALSGAAVAAVGSVGSSTEDADTGRVTARPSAAGSGRPGGAEPSPSAGGARPADRPATAQDTEAHCRAYAQVQDHGKALGSTAWQRLVAAAGGADRVGAYCAGQLSGATATPSGSTGSGRSAKNDTGASDKNTPGSGSGSGNENGNGNGSDQAGGGQGNGKNK